MAFTIIYMYLYIHQYCDKTHTRILKLIDFDRFGLCSLFCVFVCDSGVLESALMVFPFCHALEI